MKFINIKAELSIPVWRGLELKIHTYKFFFKSLDLIVYTIKNIFSLKREENFKSVSQWKKPIVFQRTGAKQSSSGQPYENRN